MPAPAAPTQISATALGRSEIRLNWVDGADNEGILIRSALVDDPAQAVLVGAVDAGVEVFRHAGLAAGVQRFYWLKPFEGTDLGPDSNSVDATTAGAAGSPGANLVGQICDAAKGRLANILSVDWKEAQYTREPEKNAKMGRDRTYGVAPDESTPGEAAVFGSYTQELTMDVVLMKGADGGVGEKAIADAEGELYGWADAVIRDFKKNRLYIPSTVLRVADPTLGKPEFIAGAEGVLLKVSFRIMYRNRIK